MEIHFGCSGWSYKSWVSRFYPVNLKASEYLNFYSNVFDSVEIDSTFYMIPDKKTVISWKEHTGDLFHFTAKIPQIITHTYRLENYETDLYNFLDVISYLGNKLAMILIQFPPGYTYDKGKGSFLKFIDILPDRFIYAVEFRDNSWLEDSILNVLREYDITLVWSDTPYLKKHSYLTSDRIYLRLIGDRSIDEKQFGKIIRDRDNEIRFWLGLLKEKEGEVKEAYVFSNNHYQGFAPNTINLLRKALGMNPINWNIKNGQRTLF